MRDRDRRELDRELVRLKGADLSLVGVSWIPSIGRWKATLLTALGRSASAIALTPAGAVVNARKDLGYRLLNGKLVYERKDVLL